MIEAVIAHFVAGPDHGLHHPRITFYVLPQDKKGGMGLIMLQYGQDLRSIAGRGAIVEGDGHLFHRGWPAPDHHRVGPRGRQRQDGQQQQGQQQPGTIETANLFSGMFKSVSLTKKLAKVRNLLALLTMCGQAILGFACKKLVPEVQIIINPRHL